MPARCAYAQPERPRGVARRFVRGGVRVRLEPARAGSRLLHTGSVRSRAETRRLLHADRSFLELRELLPLAARRGAAVAQRRGAPAPRRALRRALAAARAP